MQDYLIVKGQIDPIAPEIYKANEVAPEIYKANEWQKLDRIVRATIRMHLSELVYFKVESCETAFELWKKLSETYEKKVASTKMYLIRRLYNLRMKESDLIQAHLNEYESLSSQIMLSRLYATPWGNEAGPPGSRTKEQARVEKARGLCTDDFNVQSPTDLNKDRLDFSLLAWGSSA